ncbi:carboxyl transferase domain-containing protein [Actinoplanes sp. NPDC051343]|uniref:carboxyl transferase domain-containing protein n=1 Tax=Actinoplanes sp. NPDC051343 TaxID=3363906 RepID=UPI0037BD4957
MTVLDTALDPRNPGYLHRRGATLERLVRLEAALDQARAGGGEKAVTRHHARGKLLPRERVEMLLDQDSPFLELSPVAAWGTEVPAGAGVVTGLGVVEGVECVLVANDPTVAGGAVNAYALTKIRRAARISSINRLPLVTLVESAAEDAPEAAPGGGIARDLSRLAAERVPTICVVFGATTGDAAYLPALSDYTIMVRGPVRTVTIAPQPTGEEADGPADQLAEDERDALRLARQCVRRLNWRKRGPGPRNFPPPRPKYAPDDLLTMADVDPGTLFDPREVLARILDDSDFDEFKPAQGTALVTGWGELHGYPVAVLANVGAEFTPAETQKAVHFIQLANAADTSLLFLRHPGPPGREEQAAPLVHALAKSTVPHLVLLVGGAAVPDGVDEPRFVFSWPVENDNGAGEKDDDGVIDPRDTRTVLGICLSAVHSAVVEGARHVGVFRPGKVDQ